MAAKLDPTHTNWNVFIANGNSCLRQGKISTIENLESWDTSSEDTVLYYYGLGGRKCSVYSTSFFSFFECWLLAAIDMITYWRS